MDTANLADLYRRFAPLVHARARRMVGHDADDVVQEVFMRLLRSSPAAGKEASWIFTTATNLCVDRLRYRLRRDRVWRDELRRAVTGAPAGAPDQLAEARELCTLVLAHVDGATRKVAALVYLDEMTQIEAAAALGVSRKTVAKRLKRFNDKAQRMIKRWQS